MQTTGSQTAAWPRTEPRTFLMWSVFLFWVTSNFPRCLWAKHIIKNFRSQSTKIKVKCCLCGLERSESVPSPPRRSWWRTPTAAQSLSASPWCLCRSQCHPASTCSTSPGRDKGERFQGHMQTHCMKKTFIKALACMSCLIPGLHFVPCCHTSLPPTRYSGI